MNEASKKSSQLTLPGIDELTSSPGPGSGRSRPKSPGGLKTDPSGPPPARANRSRSPGSERGSMTSETSGPSSSDWFESADLPSLSVSKSPRRPVGRPNNKLSASKICNGCGIEKPSSMFCKASDTADGTYSRCRECRSAQQKAQRQNPEKAARLKASERRSHHKNRTLKRGFYLVKEAKNRARKMGLSFNLDEHRDNIQARVMAGVCEMTGIPFSLQTGLGHIWDSPSLDRIDPKIGYEIMNVRVVLLCLNVMMNNWGEAKLIEVVDALKAKRQATPTLLDRWEANLKRRLDAIGSTECTMIWKEKVTPSGRSVWQHVPSTRHTNGSGFTGSHWPTLRANNEAATLTGTDRAGWDLPTKMTTSNWPTPTVADVEGGRKTRSGARGDEMLLNGLMSAPRVTPSARDWKDSVGMATSSGDRNRMDQWPRQMAHAGPTTNGSPAQTEKRGASRGSPNPYFAAWLMGWPEWLISGAHTAILKHKAR